MDLSISHISFHHVRSYEALTLHDIGPLTLFVGPNAAGKTNIVEGIQLLTAHTSFRNPTIDQLIHFGAPFGKVQADITDTQRHLSIELRLEDGKKKYFLNGKPKRTADLKGLIPSVIFTPDDISLAKGSMSLRRSAIDALGSQLSANHYLLRRDYEKILRHKNRLLKDEAAPALIESVNEVLITCGAQLATYRSALFEKLSHAMRASYCEITDNNEELSAFYMPSWELHNPASPCSFSFTRDEARESLASALTNVAAEERARRRALIGPHADKIEFYINNNNAAVFGSQGQQRSVVLAWKLSEVALIQEILHQKPVLLLDDVMSELDAERRSALLAFIAGDIQTFITTTNLSYFDTKTLDRAQVISLPRKEGLL